MCCVGTRTSSKRYALRAHIPIAESIDGILSKQKIHSTARNRETKENWRERVECHWVRWMCPKVAMHIFRLRSWHKVIFKLLIESSILTKKMHERQRWRNLSRAFVEVHSWSCSALNESLFFVCGCGSFELEKYCGRGRLSKAIIFSPIFFSRN